MARKRRFHLDDVTRGLILKGLLNTALVLAVVCAVVVAISSAKQYVEIRVTYSAEPPRVVIKDRPAWMSDFLAEQIAEAARPPGGHSSLDGKLLRDVHLMLQENARTSAWIRDLRQLTLTYGQRPGDTLVLDCEFRTPSALVAYQGHYYLVDAEGVVLPDAYGAAQVERIMYGRDGQVNIRVIEGVLSERPLWPGEIWDGADLAAGLDMVKALHGQGFAEEIVRVDVSNFGGRHAPRDSHIVLLTRQNTQIRWGRPVRSEDLAEVHSTEKLRRLERIHSRFGRVDAGQAWVDIRTDLVTMPSPARTVTSR
jgi:hypothetical protein